MLISCVIATGNRPQFIHRAVALFSAQTYEEKELVIVDDFHAPSVKTPIDLPKDVVYLRCEDFSQGRKLDVGLRCASGELLQKWDDDDLYLRGFLDSAVHAYRENSVTCLRKCLIVTLDGEVRVRNGRFTGGTITISRDVFKRIGMVSDVHSDVDGDVIRRCVSAGVVPNGRYDYFEEYAYVRHGANTWNGMCSRVRSGGELEHVTHDEAWKALPLYDGPKKEEVVKWLQ